MASQSTFGLPIRVYIEDTDAGGIVFYANYLKYFERSRTELIRNQGYQLRSSLDENISFVVHSLQINYRKPARLDDLVTSFARIEKVGKTFIQFKQWIENEKSECLVEGNVKVACVNFDDAKPRKLPEALSTVLQNGVAWQEIEN